MADVSIRIICYMGISDVYYIKMIAFSGHIFIMQNEKLLCILKCTMLGKIAEFSTEIVFGIK